MHSTGLRPLVANLLEAHGFSVHTDESLEGRSGAVYHVPVLAEGDQVLLVEFKESPDPVEDRDIDYLGKLVDDAGADHAILIHEGPAPYGLMARDDVTMWGPSKLRAILGDHLLHAQADAPLAPLALGRTAPSHVDPGDRPFQPAPPPSLAAHMEELPVALPELTDSGFADLLPSAFQEDPEDDVVPMIDFDALESLDAPTPPARRPVDAPPAAGIGPSILKPRIPVHEARAMVKDRLTRVDHEQLILRPIHLFDYECDLMVGGTLLQDTAQGRIQVHGDKQGTNQVDKAVYDPSFIGTFPWDGTTEEHPFRRDEARARQDAKALIMEAHTKMVDVQADDDASDFTMVERKKVAPDGDQIRITHLAATYHPLWKFESDNGYVVMDALTGDVVDESLRTRRGDTIILD